METILRDSLTGLYYGGNQAGAPISGPWISIRSGRLPQVAQEQKLETVNVVLRYEEPTCELVLPLSVCIFNAVNGGTKRHIRVLPTRNQEHRTRHSATSPGPALQAWQP